MNILPNEITVVVDTRENYPLLFPKTIVCWELGKRKLVKVRVRQARLEAGDYLLENYPATCIVERKGSAEEIASNLFTKDQKRQSKAFAKLKAACKFPTLLLEMTPTQLLKGSRHLPDVDGSLLLSKLMTTLSLNNFHLLWTPWGKNTSNRIMMGEVVLHHLLGYVVAEATTLAKCSEAGG